MAEDRDLERQAFWFLRHGETDWNARNLSQGAVEIPLNEKGIAQAQAAAARLVGRGIVSLIASPVGRARVTAEIVAAKLGLSIAYDEGLREASYGVREGQLMSDWFQQWVDGTATPEGAEPFSALRHRAVAAINRSLGFPGPVLVIAHGGLFRAVRAAMGLEPNIRTPNATPYWCEPAQPAWLLTPAA